MSVTTAVVVMWLGLLALFAWLEYCEVLKRNK
jgi:hypothetical protein